MKGKVTCSCGHSWNTSDSSKKDVNVCHICGKDNTMKDGGWLDKYQDGGWTVSPAVAAYNKKARQTPTNIDANAMAALEQVTSYPQRKVTELITGTNQYPSQAMGIQNPYGAFAIDAIADPVNLVGAGLLGKVAKASTKTGILSKAYKINPWAFKPNEANWYRQVGQSAIDDALETGLVREAREEVSPRMWGEFQDQIKRLQGDDALPHEQRMMQQILSSRRPISPFFAKGELFYPMGRKETISKSGKISKNSAGRGNADYLIETSLPNESFQPAYVKGMSLGVPDMVGSTAILKPNPALRNLSNFQLYKQHWLQGYKPIKENGGWLDKYNDGGPIQPNYNDYSVSAPEGFQGDGYSNVGRNYSPAWGGQFKEGGELPNVTVKGKRQPITVTDKNDPRLKAYQDSLSLFNESKNTEDKVSKIFAKAYKRVGFDKSTIDETLYRGKDIILNPKKYTKEQEHEVGPRVKNYNKKGLYSSSVPDREYLGTPEYPATIQNLIKYNKEDIKYYTPYLNSLDEDINGLTAKERIELANITNASLQKQNNIIKRTGYNPTYFIPNAERTPNLIFKKPTQPVVYKPEPTPQSIIDFMEGNYGQEPIIEIPQPQSQSQVSPYGEVVDPRTGYTHMTRQGSPMYPMVGQNIPEMEEGGPVKRFMQPTETFKNLGYNPIKHEMSTELSTSIGGPGEVYLVPGYRQGRILQDPEGVFNAYGEHIGGPFKTVKAAEDFGKLRHQYVEKNQNIPAPIKTRDYAMGGSLPGSVGFMYARTNDPAPSNGKYAKKTKASAKNGTEMEYYQNGLDWKPRNISKNGKKVIKDDRGQWDHPGEITQIGSNQITMQGVPYPVMGISDTGDTQMMYPNQEYQYNGNSVTEYPMMQDGGMLDSIINLGKRAVNYVGGLFDDEQPVAKAAPVKPKADAYDTMLDLGFNNPQIDKLKNLYKTNRNKVYLTDKNKVALNTGRFKGANVSAALIDDIAAAAKRNKIPVGQLLTLAGRESTFGQQKGNNRAKKDSANNEYMSGWNVAEDYSPYDPHRFLADKKVPGINVLKDSGGYIYEVADEKAAREYLKKNPQLIEQYKKKLTTTPDIGNRNYFDLSAEFLKKKGIQGYNPGDPTYVDMFNQDYNTLKQDKELMSYLKKKGYKYEQGGQLTKLDQLTNFTNYNTKQPGGWLDKYNN